MRAHVLSVGSELLLGHLTDTNATYLAQELAAQGIELLHVTQIGDDLGRLIDVLRHAAADAELIVCTGGVGPTEDDLTREAIAAFIGQDPSIDPALLATLRSFFAARGVAMPERNAKQAWLIPAAESLPNPVGTAPGWFVRHDGRFIVAMPGVPREMFRMWREQALPRIVPSLPDRAISSITIRTLGIGESAAEQVLAELVQQSNPIVATYAKDDGVHVRVTASAGAPTEAIHLRDTTAAEVRSRLQRFVYGADSETLPAALIARLRERGISLGVVEQGTGGRFGVLIAADPAAGSAVRGSLSLLATDPALSARDLSRRAIESFGVALGLGIAVSATDDGQGVYSGSVEIVLSGAIDAAETVAMRSGYEDVQRRAALSAADVLRRALAPTDDR